MVNCSCKTLKGTRCSRPQVGGGKCTQHAQMEGGFVKNLFGKKTSSNDSLITAAGKGDLQTAKKFLSFGADPNMTDIGGNSPLHEAAISAAYAGSSKLSEIIDLLLKAGSNPNLQNNFGETPLLVAAQTYISSHKNEKKERDMEVFKLLLKNGADPSIKNHAGSSALTAFKRETQFPFINTLLAQMKGGFKNPFSRKTKTLEPEPESVITAAEKGDLLTVKKFLAEGVDPNMVDKSGQSALFRAAIISTYSTTKNVSDFLKVVEVLLENGSNPNLQDLYGNTPLLLAVDAYIDGHKNENNNHAEVFKLLLKHGANPNIKNNDNDTALTIITPFPTVYKTLEKYQ